MPKIRVAIAGVGNCCSSFVQGIELYSKKEGKPLPFHKDLNGYRLEHIQIALAFDVDRRKIGKDLAKAIFIPPNTSRRFSDVRPLGIKVAAPSTNNGLREDGSQKTSDLLRKSEIDVLVNLTPTGASGASEYYAAASCDSGVAFLNATTTSIASDHQWSHRFNQAKVPVAGDDIMDQVGSTILHKTILSALIGRRVSLEESYQLDIGGGSESKLALDKQKYSIKRDIKTKSVSAAVPYSFPLVVGSSDYAQFLENRRVSYFWLQGRYFGGAACKIDIRLEYEEAPACAAQLIDVVRILAIARDRGISGALESGICFAFKNPPRTFPPESMEDELQHFLKGDRPR